MRAGFGLPMAEARPWAAQNRGFLDRKVCVARKQTGKNRSQ
jgi:hypothetical protein